MHRRPGNGYCRGDEDDYFSCVFDTRSGLFGAGYCIIFDSHFLDKHSLDEN